jgi:hypothetical protein
MLIYGSAMMGWLMVQIGPMIAYAMISGFHRTQVMRLNFNQKRIENEWGPEVTQFDKPHSEDDE